MARRRQSITITHVAADAGVSLQTVSRVINKRPNVRPAVAARVQASIDKLGYVPLVAAQRMAGSRSYLILAFLDRDRTIADWRERQGTDWVDQMMLGAMLTCSERGYRLLMELLDAHDDHSERQLATTLASLRPDGVILTPPHSANPRIVGLLTRAKVSFARIGSLEDGPGFALTMDDERAARRATEHLIALGHREIGFIAGPAEYALSGWRVDGWRLAMTAAGLPVEGLLAGGDFGYESGLSAASMLLDRTTRPTAIIASNDRMSLATLDAARGRGMTVPNDLSVVSFDDTPVVRFTNPPLTAVVQPIAEASATAVKLIIAEQGGAPTASGPIVVPAGLAVRQSTARPR